MRTVETHEAYLAVRRAALAADKRNAAYVVVSQRPSPTGSHLLLSLIHISAPTRLLSIEDSVLWF